MSFFSSHYNGKLALGIQGPFRGPNIKVDGYDTDNTVRIRTKYQKGASGTFKFERCYASTRLLFVAFYFRLKNVRDGTFSRLVILDHVAYIRA
jgi:hypothetical protein